MSCKTVARKWQVLKYPLTLCRLFPPKFTLPISPNDELVRARDKKKRKHTERLTDSFINFHDFLIHKNGTQCFMRIIRRHSQMYGCHT